MKTTSELFYQPNEFAELAGVTVRTLHHYDRIGLLRPSSYTEAGYRLYRKSDLVRLQQVVTLKFIGLSLKQIRRTVSPDVVEKGQRDWANLIREVEETVDAGIDPGSEKAQALAARWSKLIKAFTGGDTEIQAGLNKLYADQANWPTPFPKPYSDEVGDFICTAIERREEK